MGTITAGTGLISGLDTKSIIDQLVALEGKQRDLVQEKVDKATAQRTAYVDLTTRLTGIQITSQQISKPSFFANATAASSNEDVATATAAAGAPVGSYQFRVARLVQAQQMVTGTFGDPAKALPGAGKLTVELGGGQVTQPNNLNDLRGGAGVSRGQLRITDRAGHSAIIDLSDAVTLDDVVKKFNTAVDVNVKASVVDNKLTLADATGLTTGKLIVQDVGSTTSAVDLGIAATNTTGTITGQALNYIGLQTRLASLNDGNGVGDPPRSDFRVNLRGGYHFDVDLRNAVTVGDAIKQIGEQTQSKVVASINADGTGLKLKDTTNGGGTFATEALNGTTTAADLGIDGAAAGNTINGSVVQAATGTVLLKNLNGGAGLTGLDILHVVRRNGSSFDADLSTAKTLQDVINKINTAAGSAIAGVNASGNGLQLADSSGTGNLVVSDTDGSTATKLGLGGTFTAGQPVVNGANLQRKWVSNAMPLASYNGGKGISAGDFEIAAADGTKYTISIDPSKDLTLGDVIVKINAAAKTTTIPPTQVVTAGINANGDGLLLTDNSGGPGVMTVTEKGSSTAANLNLLGKATANVINGSMEKTIDVAATDTLTMVQKKINDLSWGLSATVMNDGSGPNAYRLALNSSNAGVAGQVTFDAGATQLSARTLVKAQDAAVFVGSSDTTQPLLITSNKNAVTNAVKGVTLNLVSVSDKPITISVTPDVKNVTDALQTFVDAYNELSEKIDTYTSFRADSDTSDDQPYKDADGNVIDPNAGTNATTDASGNTFRRGILLGDYSISQIQDRLSEMLQTVVPQAGKYRILERVGLSLDGDGKLAFDADKFNAAYADDPNSVKSLFTQSSAAINNDTPLRFLNDGKGIATAAVGQDDFKASLKDGTDVTVSLNGAETMGDIIKSINAAGGGGKLLAEIGTDYKLVVSDLTTGVKASELTLLNGSQALANLGMITTAVDGKFSTRRLASSDPLASATGGVGVSFQKAINGLINPVDGLIAGQSKSIDNKITQFQGRISDLNTMLDQKRSRLERQFSNLENVLAKLKTQQSSLGSIGTAA